MFALAWLSILISRQTGNIAVIGATMVSAAVNADWAVVLQSGWIADSVSMLAFVPLVQAARARGLGLLSSLLPRGGAKTSAYIGLIAERALSGVDVAVLFWLASSSLLIQ